MNTKIWLVLLLVIGIICKLYFIKSTFENLNFNKTSFLQDIHNKKYVVLCGNSVKFQESFKKISQDILQNAYIIRFNTVLDHLPEDTKTDTLFISSDVKNNNNKNIEKWSKKCKVVFIDTLKNNEQVFNNYPVTITSGLSVLIFLLKYIDPKKIILVGFDMVNAPTDKFNWFRETVIWSEHNITLEKQLLSELVSKNNIRVY